MAVDINEQSTGCAPDEIGLKSFFLGPQAENAEWLKGVLDQVLESYFRWRRAIYPEDGRAISEADLQTPEFRQSRALFHEELEQLLGRFESEVPKYSPRYIGHMFSETSMPAVVGHVVTLLHNPNNISGESSRVGVGIEDEAIGALAAMFGFDEDEAQGHFTSGGTVANFEAMVRARRRMERFIFAGARAKKTGRWHGSLVDSAHMGWEIFDELEGQRGVEPGELGGLEQENPFVVAEVLSDLFGQTYRGPVILVPEHKHYSWVKGVDLMGLGREAFWSVELDEKGVICVESLRGRIEEARAMGRPVMMVVSVAGTTELGAFDPVGEIQDLLDGYKKEQGMDIWHHVDAAYGGFFAANVCGGDGDCVMADGVCEALLGIYRANSVTLDPHKLGYVPYSSGAFIARDSREYFSNSIDAPYLVFEERRDRGPQTIEGSRSAAGAVATWLTARTIGLHSEGYGRILRRTIQARKRLEEELLAVNIPVRMIEASSNVLAICVAEEGEALSVTNERSRAIFEAFSPRSDGEFFVSRTSLRFSSYGAVLQPFIESWGGVRDVEELMMIRLCVMNPFLDSRETKVDFPKAFAEALALCSA